MKKKKILLVDDDPNILEGLSDILVDEGYDIVTASNGQEALDKIHQDLFNLVITDVKMPIMDGMALLREIEKTYSHIEIILISAYANQGEQIEATRLGAYEYLEKPLKISQLKAIISQALKAKDVKPLF